MASRRKQHGRYDQHDGERGSEVGPRQHQGDRDPDHEDDRQQGVLPVVHGAAPLLEEVGEKDHQDDLRQL